MDNINDTVGDGVQNSILTAIDSIILLEIDLDFGSKSRLPDDMRPVLWRAENLGNT